ncbi:MAG: tyrosine-protein phosphatase [bacterium]
MTTDSNLREPEGIHNFRELANYEFAGGAIRPGRIYRSGALELMSEADREWLAEELEIRTILDLRHADELALRKGPHPLEERVRPHSIFPQTNRLEDVTAELNGLHGVGISPARYLHYLDIGGDRLASAFQLFAEEENYPFLVHCTAGKDRTGVLLGLIMEVLGCSDEDIANEYGLSDANTDALIAYLVSSGRQLEGSEDEIRARLATPPEKMAGFLKLMREKYGSAAGFLLSQGVSQEEIDRVREVLS